MDCFVCSGFVLVLPKMHAFQLSVGVPAMELYAGFWDVLRLGGVPIGFEKLLSLRFWSSYRFARRSSS